LENPDIWAAEPDREAAEAVGKLLLQNPAQALSKLQDLADRGSVLSLIGLGYLFENGLSVQFDLSKAEEYYRRAFEKGSNIAAIRLVRMSVRAENYDEAEKILLVSAARNDPQSMYWLGKLYLRPATINEKLQPAVDWLQQAYSRGHQVAGVTLGGVLVKGYFGFWNIFRGVWMLIRGVFKVTYIGGKNLGDERLKDLPGGSGAESLFR
jgi:TPR repeat protein